MPDALGGNLESFKQPQARIATVVFIIGMLSFAFNNCSGSSLKAASTDAKDTNSQSAQSSQSIDLTKGTTAVVLAQGSGALAPEYLYSIEYLVDFQKKKLVVTAFKGDKSTVVLPAAGERSISDDKINQIKLKLNDLGVTKACSKDFAPLSGGNTLALYLYTTNLSSHSSFVNFGPCTGYSTSVPEYIGDPAKQRELLALLTSI